jgi:hypothetical protein
MYRTYTATEMRQLRKEAEKKPAKPKKRPEVSAHTKALKKADTAFSLWFRANEADENGRVKCCTCGASMNWKEPDGNSQTGHWQSRGFSAVRFMPENCGVQNIKCNMYQEGRKKDMEAYLRKRHGDEVVDKIEMLAKLPNKRLSDFELNEIAKFYQSEYKKLVKLKGLV